MQAPPAYASVVTDHSTSRHHEGYQPNIQPVPAIIPAIPENQFQPQFNQPTNNQYAFVPQANLQRFREICQQNEISDFFALKLRQLEGFDIVIIADDSGSMSTPLQNPALVNASPQLLHQIAFGPTYRRWDELKSCVSIIVDIASCFDSDGIDVHFLNRPGLLNITNPSQIMPAFQAQPSGFTPINQTLINVLQHKAHVMTEKKLLVVIMTDGEPTNASGQRNTEVLERTLRQRSAQCHVTFVACTDDDSVMAYLNGWDESIPRLDVVDDYISERREIVAVQGPQFRFSHGDWIVKSLLGSIDPTLDKLDERKPLDTLCGCTIS